MAEGNPGPLRADLTLASQLRAPLECRKDTSRGYCRSGLYRPILGILLSSQEDLARLPVAFDEKGINSTGKVVYEKTVAELATMYLPICNGGPEVPLQRGVATMPLLSCQGDSSNLDARALALLARNLALLGVTNSVWWLHGSGRSQSVTEISIARIVKMLPLNWAWTIEWPFNVLADDLRPLK
jgi:hypothetical protein